MFLLNTEKLTILAILFKEKNIYETFNMRNY